MKARSQVKCKIGDEDRYIDCSIHDARITHQSTIELRVRIGKQTMWVPKSDVTLATPFKMTVDL